MKKPSKQAQISRQKRSYRQVMQANADLVGALLYALLFLIGIWIAFAQLQPDDEQASSLAFSYFVLCSLGFAAGLMAIVISALRCLFHFHSRRFWGFAAAALLLLLAIQVLAQSGSFYSAVSMSFLIELFLTIFSLVATGLSWLIEPVRRPRKKSA